MKDTEVEKRRKIIKTRLIIAGACLFVLSVVSAFVHLYTKQNWIIWCVVIEMILLTIVLISYGFIAWSWDIKDLMTEYRKNDNLISGGLAYTGIFGFMIFLMYGASMLPFPIQVKELLQTMSSLYITAMPAFIGLLGVQFSVAIQERNRKQDLRLGAKPFFKVQCCKIIAITDENGHTCHAMKIKLNITNISNSIGIPIKVVSCDSDNCEIELPYTPLANKDVMEKEVEIKSDEPYGALINVAIIYKDVYDNTYETKIKFLQHECFDLSNTEVIHDRLLSNESKG